MSSFDRKFFEMQSHQGSYKYNTTIRSPQQSDLDFLQELITQRRREQHPDQLVEKRKRTARTVVRYQSLISSRLLAKFEPAFQELLDDHLTSSDTKDSRLTGQLMFLVFQIWFIASATKIVSLIPAPLRHWLRP